jgi:hypothetical protein
MQLHHRIARGLLVLALGTVLAVPCSAPVPAASAPEAAIPLSLGYSQSFDSLAAAGSGNPWTDDGTIAGWYSTRSSYNAGTGSSTTGSLYSFGSSGSSERALGSVASGGAAIHYGARFVNDTPATIDSISVAYTGEQWRNSGNLAQHRLEFSYQVGEAITSLTTGAWTDADALDFTGPIAGGTASALDGNTPAHRTNLALELAVEIPPGQEIMLRWSDPDDTGSDHGLAIDDLEVSAAPLSAVLEEFDATPQPNHILVTWRTGSEFNCAGFNLYRGSSAVAPELLLGFIASQAPGSTQGASYAWQDFDVTPGETLYYWLEEVDLNGATRLHGPVSATYQAPAVVGLIDLRAGTPPHRAAGRLAIPLALVLSMLGGLAGRRIRRSLQG